MKRKFEMLAGSFFLSSVIKDNVFQSFETFDNWFSNHRHVDDFKIEMMPLDDLDCWLFDKGKTRLYHSSGRFFSIEGIHVETNFCGGLSWDQPIINQPEIGILGFITRVVEGVRYFLMQVKMEPGNINTIQISPSLQATKSNFTQVHKGKRPTYLEYFNGEKEVQVLSDCLQTEQGGRFFRKRNRNIIIEVNDEIDVSDDFCWLTLYELKQLMLRNNILNMDTRSVLSTIPLIREDLINAIGENYFMLSEYPISEIGEEFIQSYITTKSLYSIEHIISWYTQQKIDTYMKVESRSLSKLNCWEIGEYAIENSYRDRFFSVIGVKVTSSSREIYSWMQPLIKDNNVGLLAFIIKKINGVLHFMVQAKAEPGNIDVVELSPTVSCSNYEYVMKHDNRPPFLDLIFDSGSEILYDTLQSEEGGRFYKVQNRNMVVLIKHEIILPKNYIWMSLRQINELMRYGMFNIEARSIISSICFAK